MTKIIDMRNLFSLILVFFLVGCSTSRVDAEDYINCTHKYDGSRDILVQDRSDIQKVSITECPPILLDADGKCPTLVKIINLDNEEIWLTENEFENYVCRTQEIPR